MAWFPLVMLIGLLVVAVAGVFAVRYANTLKQAMEAKGAEIAGLHYRCIALINSRPPSTSVDNEGRIHNQFSIEHLRLYARFLDRFDTVDLDRVISVLQTAREKRLTTLTSEEWTNEHMDIYQQFRKVTSTLDQTRPNLILIKPTIYSIHHPEDMPLVLSIVRDRGIQDMDEIEPLLREMKTSGAASLAEGML